MTASATLSGTACPTNVATSYSVRPQQYKAEMLTIAKQMEKAEAAVHCVSHIPTYGGRVFGNVASGLLWVPQCKRFNKFGLTMWRLICLESCSACFVCMTGTVESNGHVNDEAEAAVCQVHHRRSQDVSIFVSQGDDVLKLMQIMQHAVSVRQDMQCEDSQDSA